jgi:hypothetical protein
VTRFVVLCTLRRGTIEPPELLDDANQYRANLAAETQEQIERDPSYQPQRSTNQKRG